MLYYWYSDEWSLESSTLILYIKQYENGCSAVLYTFEVHNYELSKYQIIEIL